LDSSNQQIVPNKHINNGETAGDWLHEGDDFRAVDKRVSLLTSSQLSKSFPYIKCKRVAVAVEAIKAYGGSRYTAPLILKPDIRWK
jgi:hypothetical protein